MDRFVLALVVCVAALFMNVESPHPAERIAVIFDTDIGTDVDDAFALALILKSPELRLLGVTTVAGDTQARARLAAKMLWVAGGEWRKVPVYAGKPGSAQPIDQTRWADGFTSPSLHLDGAVEFMRKEINARPGEVTIVSVGEETNVAELLKAEPSISKKIRQIVLMGGSIAYGYGPGSKPTAEWNIKSNPAAASVVFGSGIPLIVAPLDVTAMLQLDFKARHRVFSQLSPVTDALATLYNLWGNEVPTLFDPMAVAMLIKPDICETKQLHVEVDSQGNTRTVEGKPPNATVGMHTDPAKFFELYLSRVAPRK